MGIFFLLFLILIIADIASAGSKHGFVPIDESDFLYYFPKHEQEIDPYIYLFSTTLFMSRNRDIPTFIISKYSSKYIAPLSSMEIYPEFNVTIQSEFFDSTIWGQLGNYFNKSLELIQIESEIIEFLQKFKSLNERYKDLIPPSNSIVPRLSRLPTLDKRNYVAVTEEAGSGKACKSSENSRYTVANCSIHDLYGELQRYATQFPQEKLRLHPTFQMSAPDTFGQRSSAVTYGEAVESARRPEASKTEVDSIFIRIFNSFTAFARYAASNKIEACIYIYFLFLLGCVTKMLLQK